MVHPMNVILLLKYAHDNAKISILENGYLLFSNLYTTIVTHLQEPFRTLLQWFFLVFSQKISLVASLYA